MIEKLLGFFGINTSVDNQDRITIDHFTKDEYKSISRDAKRHMNSQPSFEMTRGARNCSYTLFWNY